MASNSIAVAGGGVAPAAGGDGASGSHGTGGGGGGGAGGLAATSGGQGGRSGGPSGFSGPSGPVFPGFTAAGALINPDPALTDLAIAAASERGGACSLLPCINPGPGCAADLDGDGSVGSADLATLLGSWGACPEPLPKPRLSGTEHRLVTSARRFPLTRIHPSGILNPSLSSGDGGG